MKILSSGTSGVVVEPFEQSHCVQKVYLDKRSLQSYNQETDPFLWRALNSFDAEERYFVKAHPVDPALVDELFSKDFLDKCYQTVIETRERKKSAPYTTERIKPRVLCMRKLKPLKDSPKITLSQKEELRGALNKLHAAGVVHFDLHRWNIMWDPENHGLKIIDFGEWAPLKEPHAMVQRLEDIQAFLESFIEIFAIQQSGLEDS